MKGMNRKSTSAASLGFVTCLLFGTLGSVALGQDASHEQMGMDAQVLLKTTVTAADQQIQLPSGGKPEITSMVVTIQPGGHSNLHTHPVPVIAYVLEGTLETRFGEKVHNYKTGEAVVEPSNTPMQAFNPGEVPTKLLVVMVGQEGQPNSAPVK